MFEKYDRGKLCDWNGIYNSDHSYVIIVICHIHLMINKLHFDSF